MDYNQILHTVQNAIPTAIWYLIPFFLVAVVIKSAWFKGKAGEAVVNLSARLSLDKTRYHLIKNVTLPTEDGTTQIYHIIVSRYGVFVVETKNMKGCIFGSAEQKYWMHKFFKHSQKFERPLRQSPKHMRTFWSLLGWSVQQVHSWVLFVVSWKFETKIPTGETQGDGHIQFIRSHSGRVLSEAEGVEKKLSLDDSRIHSKRIEHTRDIYRRLFG